jgi:hypothetical protein
MSIRNSKIRCDAEPFLSGTYNYGLFHSCPTELSFGSSLVSKATSSQNVSISSTQVMCSADHNLISFAFTNREDCCPFSGTVGYLLSNESSLKAN